MEGLENEKIKKIDKLGLYVLVINIVLFVVFRITNYDGIIWFLNLCSLFFVLFLILTPHKWFSAVTIIKLVLYFLFIGSFYRIFSQLIYFFRQ